MRQSIRPNELFRPRIGRLVAPIRATFAVVSLFAIWLDPNQPATYPQAAYYLLACYTFYSVLLTVIHWNGVNFSSRWWLAELVVDMLVFSVLMFLTEGPTSPFFVWFNLIVLSATLTRGWRWAVGSSMTLIALYIGVSATFYMATPGPVTFELDRILIRSGYLVLAALLLAYFTREQERIANDFARVLNWSGRSGSSVRPPLEEAAGHASAVAEARRVIVIWSEAEEPAVCLATLAGSSFSVENLPPGTLDAISDRPRAWIRSTDGDCVALEGDTFRFVEAIDVGNDLEPLLGQGAILVHEIRTDQVEGFIILLREREYAPEDLLTGSLLATQVGVALDRTVALDAWRDALAVEERLRLAHDLHDGILQSLAGTALQLNRIAEDGAGDVEAIKARVRVLDRLLADEQRQLRRFIERLRPGSSLAPTGEYDAAEDLAALAERLQLQWGAEVQLRCPQPLPLPRAIQFDLHQIGREAVANSVKHGQATTIIIEALPEEGQLMLIVTDNGTGLPEHGAFQGEELVAGIGSRSLRERIAKLGGTMSIASAPGNMRVSMTLPRPS